MYAQPQFNVVYTSGTFDLFHSNHLSLLKRAKQLCKMLIVGVNTDELVCSYKNPPTIPFEERIAIVDALSCVDMAIPQKTLDHSETLEKINADCFVVGDDWYPKYDYLREHGVPVVYLPYGLGVSTSSLKKSIADDYSRLISKTKSHDNPDPRITSGKSSEFPQASVLPTAVKSMR